jgi:CheY-like chemotaxis protein
MTVSLRDVRVLIVEDEALVTMLIEDILNELGCKVAGIASELDEALAKSAQEAFDVAILDVNLNGSRSFRVAEKLLELRLPFVFSTGYGLAGVPAAFHGIPVLVKPFREDDLKDALLAALQRQAAVLSAVETRGA